MGVAQILTVKGADVVNVTPESTVREVVERLTARRIGAVLVCNGCDVVGILSERDVVRGLAAHGSAILDRQARDIMTAPVITIRPMESVATAMEMMTDRRIRHLPVMESGELVGIVSIGDLVKRRIEDAEQEALALKDYIAAG